MELVKAKNTQTVNTDIVTKITVTCTTVKPTIVSKRKLIVHVFIIIYIVTMLKEIIKEVSVKYMVILNFLNLYKLFQF